MSISSTLVHRAEIRFHEAADALRPFVGCFWVVTADRDATIRVVPDGSTAISMQWQKGQPSEWFLRGPLLRPDERCFTSPAMLIGIRLRPGVAFLLSRIPMQTLVGQRIPLRGMPAFDDLVAEELRPFTPERCIEVLQNSLLRHLEHASLHTTVAAALREIEREHGCVRVPDIAARCQVSSRQLHRLMRVWVGYGPKSYANVVRFQTTLHGMDDVPGRTAAALASENGFFDQAHLTLDVARFAGSTPGRLTSTSVADFSKTRCNDLP
jgi:methylphosphotriester-DNA--protein-cysteine methyltransferase